MKILVLEYITGGGLKNEPLPEPLALEGDLMLAALLGDLVELPGIEILVFRDCRMRGLPERFNAQKVKVLTVYPEDDFDRQWNIALRQCDAIWPIAPETDGILANLCAEAESSGCILLNSSAKAVRLTSSKLETGIHCQKHGIAYIPSIKLQEFDYQFEPPWVIKPDDGVGCEGARIIRTRKMLERNRNLPSNESLIVQPFTPGTSESLSVLCDGKSICLLSINQQMILIDSDRFTLTACRVNIADTGLIEYQRLIGAIAGSFPGLWGYVGIDLITHEGKPKVLEVNPRLTTSYFGLNGALGINTASIVLGLLDSPLSSHRLSPYNRKIVEVNLENYHVS